jgi:hypothetical protein
MNKHATVWIDHKEARIFHLHPDRVDETTIQAPQQIMAIVVVPMAALPFVASL